MHRHVIYRGFNGHVGIEFKHFMSPLKASCFLTTLKQQKGLYPSQKTPRESKFNV